MLKAARAGGLADKAYAIQGFGNVGAWAAELFEEEKGRVVAVSDAFGATHNDAGLDVKALRAHVAAGGKLADFAGGAAIDKSDILKVDCDVLVPAAIGGVIDESTAGDVRAKYVVEAANGPTTPEGKERRRRGERELQQRVFDETKEKNSTLFSPFPPLSLSPSHARIKSTQITPIIHNDDSQPMSGDRVLRERGVTVLPDIYTNGGGVTVSFFEWVQNLQNFRWDESAVNEVGAVPFRSGIVQGGLSLLFFLLFCFLDSGKERNEKRRRKKTERENKGSFKKYHSPPPLPPSLLPPSFSPSRNSSSLQLQRKTQEARQDHDGRLRGRLEGGLGERAAPADGGLCCRAAAGDEGAPAPGV